MSLTVSMAKLYAEIERQEAEGLALPLSFSGPNAKTRKLCDKLGIRPSEYLSFSLSAGVTCPGARSCRAWVVEDEHGKRRLVDGPDQKYRCFSASQEVMFAETFKQRRANTRLVMDLCRTGDPYAIAAAFLRVLPLKARVFRWHIGGDIPTHHYFIAMIIIAAARPETRFYGYTKSIDAVARIVATLSLKRLPDNLKLTLSAEAHSNSRWGDARQIIKGSPLGLHKAYVVGSEKEAQQLGLPVDHDDSLALEGAGDFALVVHGGQKPRSWGALSQRAMRKEGEQFGYSTKK